MVIHNCPYCAEYSYVKRLSSNGVCTYTSTIGLSFVGRFVLFQSVHYWRFHSTCSGTAE